MKADSKEVRSIIVLISAAVNTVLEVRTIHPFPSTEAYYAVKGEGMLRDPFCIRKIKAMRFNLYFAVFHQSFLAKVFISLRSARLWRLK